MTYNPKKIESKWQKYWQKNQTFQVDLKKAKKPYYNLMMFPYPSAEGLHVGNVYAFTGSDIHGRFRKMQGFDVFEPMGFDAFGIHSENFAIKKKIHPKILVQKNVDTFREQLKKLGCLFDWRHEVDTTKPDYYRWTQWLFLQLFKAGLAYRKKAPVDWCPSCKTVLADEQVINGKCERCDAEVIQKELEQWFFKITKYAEKLLKNLDKINWSERTKIAQKNWIGKSEGALIKFQISNLKFQIEVFTTRPDTLFGSTYLVLAPEHYFISWLLKQKVEIKNKSQVKKYINQSKKKTEIERISEIKNKTGVEIKGVKAINPANNQAIPIFIADYVLSSYGTGAIMAVPAHDQRDFDFAKKYNLPIVEVISSLDGKKSFLEKSYSSPGILINSDKFNGIDSEKAKKEIIKFVKAKKIIQYHLRDWLISRQRYWGPPIPIIYCLKCGTQPVPEKDLPVELPFLENFRPKGTGESPLASVKNFVETKCPKCKGPAKRETDVSDTFLDSSWYFFRYLSACLTTAAFDKKTVKKWLPVNIYIGGQEHAVLHLLYSRFITMVLKDLNYIDFEEPFKKFRAHGLLTKSGSKMSKSKGNVVNPDDYYKKFGADVLRMYLMFIGPFQEGGDWQDLGIIGVKRFIEKVWNLGLKVKENQKEKQSKDLKFEKIFHQTNEKVFKDLENLNYNTAISALMILVNEMTKQKNIPLDIFQSFLKLLACFAPHITEEIWHQLGNKDSIHEQKWPKYDKKIVKETKAIFIVQINGRFRDKFETQINASKEQVEKLTLSREKVKKWLQNKKPKKIVFIPNKLINIVI